VQYRRVKLVKKDTIAEGTVAFYFQKPEDFVFQAGQFAEFTLINPVETDNEGNTRAFSLVSAPDEPMLMIATRIRDTSFKRALGNLPEGAEIIIDGPYGNFTLHEDPDIPTVVITGGIGITPVRSILTEVLLENIGCNVSLLYSNRRPKDSAFLEEFEALAYESENFTFVPVMTRLGDQPWSGEKGHITPEMLVKYVGDISLPIYYLSGPAGMVAKMRRMLFDAKVHPQNIRTEEFSGY
jgi:ferredoxin-NADP reductase